MSLTFLHTADWQLGKPFAGVVDDSHRIRLQQERIEVLQRIAAAVKEHSASFVVVAGDLFDTQSPTKSTVSAMCGAIASMEVPVYAIPGNHDHGGPGSVWEQPFFLRERENLAPNLHVLLCPEPLTLDQAVLLPCPLLRRHEAIDPSAWIRTTDLSNHGDKPRIVVAHGSVQGFTSQGEEDEAGAGGLNQISLDQLPAGELDYIALGDWHGMKQVGPNAWYSGTPELDRFPKGASNEPGRILKVTVDRGALPQVVSLPTARLGWHQKAFEFTEDQDLSRLESEISELVGSRTGTDLLQLRLRGALGMEASSRLDALLESWQARLLRLKLRNDTVIAPTQEEIQSLTERSSDPLVSCIAAQLLSRTEGEHEEAAIVRLALRMLHAACPPSA